MFQTLRLFSHRVYLRRQRQQGRYCWGPVITTVLSSHRESMVPAKPILSSAELLEHFNRQIDTVCSTVALYSRLNGGVIWLLRIWCSSHKYKMRWISIFLAF